MPDQPSAFWDDLNRELEDPEVRADFERNQAMLAEYHYTVTATGPDGTPAEVTFGPAEGAITYAEYWTGPSPWWRRARRKLTLRRTDRAWPSFENRHDVWTGPDGEQYATMKSE